MQAQADALRANGAELVAYSPDSQNDGVIALPIDFGSLDNENRLVAQSPR